MIPKETKYFIVIKNKKGKPIECKHCNFYKDIILYHKDDEKKYCVCLECEYKFLKRDYKFKFHFEKGKFKLTRPRLQDLLKHFPELINEEI